MITKTTNGKYKAVAPFTGAWIEIMGIKVSDNTKGVAPFTGAWIEIQNQDVINAFNASRTLHGCVD